MRITYRSISNKDYWHERWSQVEVDAETNNADVYPLKYALMAIDHNDGPILEAGCGNGVVFLQSNGISSKYIKCKTAEYRSSFSKDNSFKAA